MEDPHTGQLMSVSEVQETIDALDLTSMHLGQGRAAYKHAMKTLPAMPEAQRKAIAVEASQRCTGGLSMSKVLDKLCKDGHLVQVNVILPPIESEQMIPQHQEKLLLLMRQCHREAHKLKYMTCSPPGLSTTPGV